MKRIISILFLVIFTGVSCKKEFIELKPESTTSVDALYQTDKDFKDAEIGIYNVLQTQYQNMWLFGDMRGDDVWDELVKGTAAAMDLFTINNDDGVIRSTWLNYYNAINRANVLLSEISKAEASVLPNKEIYIGEAKFLRALAYFDLVRIYGEVPMVTTPLTIAESYKKPREKVSKIYDEVIIKDLLEAEAKLPAKFTGGDVGRATKGAAKSLLGKVYLTVHDFAKAEAKLKEVTP